MAGPFKLTKEEGLALIGGLEGLVGTAKIAVVLTAVVGPERTARLVIDREAVPLTRAEKIAIIDGIVPLIPGDTLRDKVRNVGRAAKPAFATKARFLEAVEHVKARIKRHAAESAASTALPALGAAPIGGYGRVNQWWKRPELLDRETTLMAQANARCYNVELVGNGAEDVLGSPAKTAQVQAVYKILLGHCRAKGLWLLVSGFNGNLGNGRYRNGKVKLSSRIPQAIAMMQFVKAQGPANVFFQPVGEAQSSACAQIEKWAAANMREFVLINNGSVGRPSAVASWAKYRAYHPVNTSSWPTGSVSKTLMVSDTGAILAQLHKGGDIYGDGNPDAIRAWIQAGAAKGFPIVAHYAFQVEGIDEACIRACGIGSAAPAQPAAAGWPAELADVTWLHANVRDWAVTTSISPSFSGGMIRVPFDKTRVWPAATSGVANGTNANVWAIVNVGGTWYAATWEWLRPGDPNKGMNCLDGRKGDHFKVAPLNRWNPRSGERFYLMVSGLARSTQRNVQARSNPSPVVWP